MAGAFRVRIEARQAVGGAGKTSSWKAARVIEKSMLVIVIWRQKWRGASTHNQLACLPSATAGANCRRQQGSLNSPFPVSPSGGKAGAGGFPPRRWHAVRQQKAPAH